MTHVHCPAISLLASLCLLAASACSDTKNGDGASGSGGTTGTAAVGGSSGQGGGSGNSGVGGNAGQQSNGGDASAALDAATVDAGSDAATVDAGHDAGSTLRACKAPVPAQNAGNACPAGTPVPLKATLIESGFDSPVFVTHAPNDPEQRLFVLERKGAIQIIENGSALGTPFLEVSVVSGQSEQGLLGLAFDPDYETSGRFFIDYIGSNAGFGTQTVVESYTVSANPDVAEPSSKTPLLTIEDPEWNHNGGMLAFGPDDCLYIGAGDGGGGNDTFTNHGPDGNGQSLSTELGKLLRVDVADVSATPPGNLSGTTIPWIWDYGLRNPWRFSFDRQTGDLYIGDVGQNQWEEVHVEPRGHGKKNYGWRFMEGKHCRGDLQGAAAPTSCSGHAVGEFELPVHDYYHSSGNNCVIGGYVYRGAKIASLQSYYLFADNGSNRIWAFVWNGTGTCATPIDLSSQLTVTGAISSFGEDADGELYITTLAGNVYRIDPA